jgi:hypothetical protein
MAGTARKILIVLLTALGGESVRILEAGRNVR